MESPTVTAELAGEPAVRPLSLGLDLIRTNSLSHGANQRLMRRPAMSFVLSATGAAQR